MRSKEVFWLGFFFSAVARMPFWRHSAQQNRQNLKGNYNRILSDLRHSHLYLGNAAFGDWVPVEESKQTGPNENRADKNRKQLESNNNKNTGFAMSSKPRVLSGQFRQRQWYTARDRRYQSLKSPTVCKNVEDESESSPAKAIILRTADQISNQKPLKRSVSFA